MSEARGRSGAIGFTLTCAAAERAAESAPWTLTTAVPFCRAATIAASTGTVRW